MCEQLMQAMAADMRNFADKICDDTIPTSIGHVTPAQLVSELTYISYATNRDQGMASEAYGRLLKIDVSAYEARYKAELSNHRQAKP
jgi:hypothetical protein